MHFPGCRGKSRYLTYLYWPFKIDIDNGKESKIKWNVAAAKQKLTQVLRFSEKEPQLIYNRNRFVAAVIKASAFTEFMKWKKAKETRSLWNDFAELQKLCDEENYTLEIPERIDRPNPLAES